MKGIQFAITVFVFVGIFYVLHWLFGKFDVSYGMAKEIYFQMLGYGFCIYYMIALYEQRLKVIGWPKLLSFAPVLYFGILLYFGKNLPQQYALVLHSINAAFFLLIAFKGAKSKI